MENSTQCPVDFISINENKVRLTAFFVLLLAVAFLLTASWPIVAFLFLDFLLRVNNWGKYSLLAVLSDVVIKQFKIKNKPVDRAPKKFAAGVGLLFALSILILALFQLAKETIVVTVVLLFFAFLESFIGFCAGCYVYSVLQRVYKVFKNN